MIVTSKKNIQINRALLKSINQPINQPIFQSINQSTNSATNKHTYKQAFNQENEWAKKNNINAGQINHQISQADTPGCGGRGKKRLGRLFLGKEVIANIRGNKLIS